MENSDEKHFDEDTAPLEISDLLTEVIRALVDHPQHVKVAEHGEGTNSSLLLITTEPSDVGKVLGKKGSTMHTIRDLFTKIAAVEGRRAVIEIVDPLRGEDRRKK
jgi:predicted RNA-binding protein YlqC (UPF0109 family)